MLSVARSITMPSTQGNLANCVFEARLPSAFKVILYIVPSPKLPVNKFPWLSQVNAVRAQIVAVGTDLRRERRQNVRIERKAL